MAQLLVAGCSFSDYTLIEKVYGEFLAEKLNVSNYIHEARGCGSNHRMWREITNHVLKKNITSDDIIIIQYTEVCRQEFWTPYRRRIIPITDHHNNSDPYGDNGTVIRFKIDSHKSQDNSKEKSLFRLLEIFLNNDFENEKFIVNHNMFQTFMSYHNFKKVFFLKGGSYGPDYDLIPEYKNNYIDGNHLLQYHLEGDEHHLSQEGHIKTAELIYDFLKSNNYAK